MTGSDSMSHRLAVELLAVVDEADLARAVHQTAVELNLPLAMIFIGQTGEPTLRPLEYPGGFVDRVFDCLVELSDQLPDLGGWTLTIDSTSIFHPLSEGRRVVAGPPVTEADVVVERALFLAELLPEASGFKTTMDRDLCRSLDAEHFCLTPIGRNPVQGAMLTSSKPDTASDPEATADALMILGELIAPVLVRLDEHRRLAGLAKETAAAGEIAEILARPRLGLKRRLGLCLEVILNTLQSETGSIMLRKGSRLQVIAASNKKIIGLTQPLSADSISSLVARTGEILNLDKLDTAPFARHDGQYSTYRADQVLCAPIFAGRKVVGVLNVTNRRDPRAFDRLEEGRVERFLQRIGGLLDRAALNEALKKERRRLRKAYQELRALERLKKDLTNMVVHDLKGPLAEVVANLHMVGAEELSEFGREAVESALIGADDMSRMIANLLDISRLEEGRLEVNLQPIDVAEVFERTAGRLKAIINLKELEVSSNVAPDLPPAMADVVLLERIIQNLMTNAVDHTPDGTAVEFAAWVEDGKIVASLADHGPGVPPSHREGIFKMFQQAPGRDRPRTSTGLGLTFCRMAVEAHGGKIWVQDAPGGGADFRFTLPLYREER